jgi:exodeoxyribonuclease VII large subunit
MGADVGPSGLAPGSSAAAAVPVSALNAAAREILESSFGSLWVRGEIGSWRRHGSGHCYFTLRDEEAQLSCVMFRSDARQLPTDPAEGMEVAALGRLTVYEATGKYQLVARTLESQGEGLWRLAFERLRVTLAAEGLLDAARKRPLPDVPERVGVVTSRSSAALRDVIAVIRRRAPWTKILVSHCRVQGRDAAPDIVAALDRVSDHGSCDVIILTRGGGSVEDLWAFNEEAVARGIAACRIPVISAVGHEIDFTIADLVADARAPTPSAAAETAVPEAAALQGRLQALQADLTLGLRGIVSRGRARSESGAEKLLAVGRRHLAEADARLAVATGRLDALSPLATLRRGYAVPLSDDGTVLRRGDDFTIGGLFDLLVTDSSVTCRAEGITPNPLPTETE